MNVRAMNKRMKAIKVNQFRVFFFLNQIDLTRTTLDWIDFGTNAKATH